MTSVYRVQDREHKGLKTTIDPDQEQTLHKNAEGAAMTNCQEARLLADA